MKTFHVVNAFYAVTYDLRRRGEGGGEGGKEREGKNGKKEEIGDQVATR